MIALISSLESFPQRSFFLMAWRERGLFLTNETRTLSPSIIGSSAMSSCDAPIVPGLISSESETSTTYSCLLRTRETLSVAEIP